MFQYLKETRSKLLEAPQYRKEFCGTCLSLLKQYFSLQCAIQRNSRLIEKENASTAS